MKYIFCGYIADYVLDYTDYIFSSSDSREENLRYLRMISFQLTENNLHVDLRKVNVICKEAELLGAQKKHSAVSVAGKRTQIFHG